ncbi:hypothetical protein [Phreatobacter sp.]|uniref:hypothetical protein n=1 Tax=Phreatobacter sp. TaxID=1966341 RepID=UPI003F6F69D5
MNPLTGLSDAFLDRVIDTLLPGEAEGDHARPLPPATGIGLAGRTYAAGHGAMFAAIAETAGGEAVFLKADADQREAVLAAVEAGALVAFRNLVNTVLADYYEHADVLAAFAQRSTPPQPQGHVVAGADSAMAEALERVKARGPLWRR